jgi:hypothetical protein
METSGAQLDWALEVTHASNSMAKVVVGFIDLILILKMDNTNITNHPSDEI